MTPAGHTVLRAILQDVFGTRPLMWTSALYQKGSLTSAIGNDFISTLRSRSPIDMVVCSAAAGE
jgi:hypothetical protein